MPFRPRRSVLYMPGANARALEKAKMIAADCLIFDLEDSVAPEEKVEARNRVAAAVAAGGYGKRELIIRINALSTPWGAADMEMIARVGPDAVLVPKLNDVTDLAQAARALPGSGGGGKTRIWAMVETPLAVFNLRAIAAAHEAHGLQCFVLGTNDLVKEMRGQPAAGRFALVPALSMAVLAARAYGLDVIDGVYNDINDEVGFRAECEQGRALGMDGKTLIHPDQVAPCNGVFSPTADEVAWARNIIAAFSLPENAKKGVIRVKGRMVERLHLAMADRVMAIAKAITE
ncbi:MAG: CoA ester lyase [Rhizobiales bacterium]|nr:CoA ester lyase [Hyphomicrobiales bacterium]